MTTATLFQRAHTLRMEDLRLNGEEARHSEFYVGWAIGERIEDRRNANGLLLLSKQMRIHIVIEVLRRFAEKPAKLQKALLEHLSWPEDVERVWHRLLQTYRDKPEKILAIADGLEI